MVHFWQPSNFLSGAGRALAVRSGPRSPPSLIIADLRTEELEWHPIVSTEEPYAPQIASFLNSQQPSYHVLEARASLHVAFAGQFCKQCLPFSCHRFMLSHKAKQSITCRLPTDTLGAEGDFIMACAMSRQAADWQYCLQASSCNWYFRLCLHIRSNPSQVAQQRHLRLSFY